MKGRRWCFLVGVFLVVGLARTRAAQSRDFLYESGGTRAVTITGYTGPGGAVTIPDTIEGRPVTSIGDRAFYECTGLTSVTIPNSVASVGNGAFSDCTRLTRVYFLGDAPGIAGGWFVFSGADATVYYLPGTAGWGLTFAGRPTALWKPQVQNRDANFGVQTNRFGFTITWASGQVVVVEACADLTNPIWSPLQTNTLSTDTLYFSDPEWMKYASRFYRLRSP